jgi:nitrate/nitrite transport system permease protein
MSTVLERDVAPAVPTPAPDPALSPASALAVRRWERTRESAQSVLLALLGLGCFIGMWAFISWRSPDLPGPFDAFAELGTLLGRAFEASGPNGRGVLLQLGTSLGRTLQGFAFAALLGIPLGLFIGGNRRAGQAANPVIQVLRPISPLAWFPLGLVVLKDSPGAAVFVIFITALWPTLLNTAAGAASVPADQRNVARVFHFNRFDYWRRVMIPHTVPSIVTGLRLSMGTAWMVIVAAEMLSGGDGLGFFVWDSYNGGNLSAVIAAVIVIGVVGVALDHLFVAFGRRYARGGAL